MTGRKGCRLAGSVPSVPAAKEKAQVVFPCDLPQWPCVREELEHLLLHPPTPGNISQKLDNLHHISQSHDGTDTRCVTVFHGLATFLEKTDDEERDCVMDVVLPAIFERALELPHLLDHDGIPLLLKQKAGKVQLSRRAVASFVACGFLCLFPAIPHKQKDTFRPINFTNFFHAQTDSQQAKLRCILHYFERLGQDVEVPTGNITITRKVLDWSETRDLDWWQETDVPLCPIKVHHEGIIEDCPHPSVQVDFANKKIGGGVLGGGRVQEVRFVTCPEFLVTLLLVEAMDDNEAIWVEGCETFSSHEGYGKSLRYAGDYRDPAPVDGHGNLRTIICAIDAVTSATHRQYQDDFILRDINKAFIGFLQKCTEHTEEDNLADLERFGDRLSEDIIATATNQAALVLTQSRLQEHARPPFSCQRSAGGGWHRADRSDTSDTSSESHHSGSLGIGEGERSWMMGMRRRSSNLSDVGSRRSSDLTTSRRSSGSTRYSSDVSSDLEELYETFPEVGAVARQRPAAIKEEGVAGSSGSIQEFVSSMVMNVLDEGSNLAAQMMPGVQNFGGAQPPDVAKPKAFKPTPVPPPGAQDVSFDFPLDLDSSSDSSNQTDDQKAKENIVRFVSQLVEKAFVGAGSSGNGMEDDGGAGASAMRDMDHLHLHHSWSSSDSSGSPHYNHYLDVNPRGGGGVGSGHQQDPHSNGGAIGGASAAAYLHYTSYDCGRRLSHPLDSCLRFTPPVDMIPQRSPPVNPSHHRMPQRDTSSRLSLITADGSPRSSQIDVSPRISQLDGSPRSEATAMWRHQEQLLLNELTRMSGRRRSSSDFAGSLPPLDATSRQQMFPDSGILQEPGVQPFPYAGFTDSLQHHDSWASGRHGESLTDDLKEAVANSASAFHAVQAVAAAAAAAAGTHDDDHIPYPLLPDLSASPERNLSESRLSASYSDTRLRGNFQSKSDTSLLSARHAGYHGYPRQNSLDSERYYTDSLHSHGSALLQEGAIGLSPYRYSGSNTAATVAGQIVQASLETAVRTVTQQAQAVGGLAQWRSQQRNDSTLHAPRSVNFSRSLSLSKPSRKGSMEGSLSSFANSLARHGSLGELSSSRFQHRRRSSGFRDSTLSSFADQLLDTNHGAVTDPVWLDFRRHSVGGERANLFRRGSGESRCSSLSRHSSVDILFPPCITPEDPPPWGMNPPGRRSSREVVLDLLSSTSGSTVPQHRKRQQNLTSHLDWFAQDLLMEAFNDAFIELFGQDYLESFDYKRRQIRQRSQSRSSHSSSEERQLVEFADAFVQDVIQQAIEVVTLEDADRKKCRRKHMMSEEEEDGSSYEDALDIPFQMLDTFAMSLAGSVMDAARIELIKKNQRGPYPVATGNWGCGAYHGNPQIKLLLQWAAASCAGAPILHYYTISVPELQRLPEVVASVRRRAWNVGHILQYVVQYARQRRYTNDDTLLSLFDLLLS